MIRHLRRARRLLVVAALALLPLACAVPRPAPAPPPPANPFLGAWATAEHNRIVFRPDTIVQTEGLALGPSTCNGVFRFGYATRSRQALENLIPDQPGVRERLAGMLVEPRYKVAELACDTGDQTYVLLGGGRLVAIYRDGTIAGLERFSRI